MALHFNLILSSRMTYFKVIQNFNYIIGQNILTNRLSPVNGLIPLNCLNKSYETSYIISLPHFMCLLNVPYWSVLYHGLTVLCSLVPRSTIFSGMTKSCTFVSTQFFKFNSSDWNLNWVLRDWSDNFDVKIFLFF